MTATPASITLSEWETQGPDNCVDLVGRFLDASHSTHRIIERLSNSNLLGLTELRHGLEIKAFAHVGRIRVGDLNITILPKIKGTSLLSLVRYAFGFRRLKLISDSTHLVDQCGFEDLLISQLNAEVHELISRGLFRAYISTGERLSSPRGRIDLTRMVLDGGTVTASLPCQHHPRVEDTLLNRVLMAGLRLAGSIASLVELRRESRRLASLMEEQVTTVRLDGLMLDRATRQMNRLTTAYAPALSIIRLLVESQGVVLEGQTSTTTLPGFLFREDGRLASERPLCVSVVCLLDELDYLPIDKSGADLLFQVVAARYEVGSIVISTNRPFREWRKLFDVDNALATALIDRLMHHGEAIVIQGDSFRMKDKGPDSIDV